MALTIHVTIGAILGRYIPNPLLAFLVGFISHFLTDMIPHGDSAVYKRYKCGVNKKRSQALVLIDSALAITVTLLILNLGNFESLHAASFAIAGSVMPDIIIGLHILLEPKWLTKHQWLVSGPLIRGWLEAFHRFHFFMHDFIVERWRDWRYQWHGTIFQGAVLGLIVWLAKWK